MQTNFVGKNLMVFDSLDSTNKYARNLVNQKDADEGTVILSHMQRQGKGFGNNSWESDKFKNLTFTVIFKPFFLSAQKQFQLSMVISLGIADFLTLYCNNISIKWPNDIYVNDDKIAGILIENIINQRSIQYSLAGIGININQLSFSEGVPNPVSIKQLTGIDYSIMECLNLLCKKIELRYLQLKNKKADLIKNSYTSLLYRFDELREFKTGERKFKGKVAGIDEFGHLLIKTPDNELLKFDFKEISYII